MKQLDSLEAALGVSFVQKELLHLALAHRSYLNENPGVFSDSNERLEFLGDAVIGMVAAEELFARYPEWPEGRLTQARAALVQGATLAGVAGDLGLGRHLYMGRGEEDSGGRERPTNLAAVLESVVGALFLDQGYEAARDFVLRVLSEELMSLDRGTALKDAKSALQEAVQAKGLPSPAYSIVDVAGRDHARWFTAEVNVGGRVVGRGAGTRKSHAEQEAAEEALKAMGSDTR